MRLRTILLASTFALAAPVALAQQQPQHMMPMDHFAHPHEHAFPQEPAPPPPNMPPPNFGHPNAPPPPPQPMTNLPRGPQGHFLPVPQNTPQTNMSDLTREHWHGGHWEHHHHHGHFGWWWVVGPDWYLYDEPIYPYPDAYTPPGEEPGWWYWCAAYQEYYPYVTDCPSGWVQVQPRD